MDKIWETLKSGLRNYCQENGFTDVLLGLSGGLDSALVSVLAVQVLGAEHVHAIMMKTRFTSQQSLDIAAEIAKLNGFDYQVWDIEDQVVSEQAFLEQNLGEKLKGVVCENIQARLRGRILMAVSNQFGYLVLACGNKSEAATGYCTLYGDTCGGLSPIGNLYKTQIFELARYLNTIRPVLPDSVITRAPSAELSAGQKDEDSLPPYAVLDKILKSYLDNGKTPSEICAAGFEADIVEWVIRQYHKTAFKRRQMPPALSLDSLGKII